MRKSNVLQIVAGLVLIAFIAGCASLGGSKDKSAIGKTLENWHAALAAKDVDKAMTYYSEAYQSSDQGGDKSGMKKFLEQAKTEGYLSGIGMNVSNAKFAIKGDTAEVSPVDLTGSFGGVSLKLTLKREDANWRILRTDEF